MAENLLPKSLANKGKEGFLEEGQISIYKTGQLMFISHLKHFCRPPLSKIQSGVDVHRCSAEGEIARRLFLLARMDNFHSA